MFLADEAYPLLENTMRPYFENHLSNKREYFNAQLRRARIIVEDFCWKPLKTVLKNTKHNCEKTHHI